MTVDIHPQRVVTDRLNEEVQGTVTHHDRIKRTMGDSEASYFLPSREEGVNDM